MEISLLSSKPHFLTQVAELLSEEFELPVDYYKGSLKHTTTFIAVEDNELCGMCSIDTEDLDRGKYRQINNWLADLYVVKKFRRKGIASKLIDAVLNINNENIFLWTEHTFLFPLFHSKGFEIRESMHFNGSIIYVLSLQSTKPSSE